ncbi:MAG: hypothetical protein GF401_20360 [Chitinivibrionales bacterium]|nr:hypothetical protein [Chitinivibrionales bacterium]
MLLIKKLQNEYSFILVIVMENRRLFLKDFLAGAGAFALESCSFPSFFMKKREKPLFSFIFCNDLHISTPDQAAYFGESVSNWKKLSLDFDFVVLCGDLVNYGSREELLLVKEQLRHIGKPWYVVAGNHDCVEGTDISSSPFQRVFPAWRPNYLFHNKGIMMIVLDLTNETNATVRVPDATITWLSRVAPRIKPDDRLIVFSHFSLHPDVPRFPVSNTSPIFDILDTKQVMAFFSGHYHARWHGFRNGADYYCNTCLSLATGNHDGSSEEGWLWVKVYENRVETEFVEKGNTPRE